MVEQVTGIRLDTVETLDRVLRLTARAAGGTVSVLLGTDEWAETFRMGHVPASDRNRSENGDPDGVVIRHLCREIATSGDTLEVPDLHLQTISLPTHDESSEVRALIGVPIRDHKDGLAGAVCLSYPRPRDWTGDDWAALTDARELVESHLRLVAEQSHVRSAPDTSEAAFRQMVDESGGGVVTGTTDGSITYANDAYLRIVRRRREEVLDGSLRWTDLTPPEWRAADDLAITRAEQGLPIEPYEKEYVLPDGSRVPVLIATSRSRSGELIGSVIDMTDQVTARRALVDTESRLLLGMHAGRMRTWDLDIDSGKVAWLNPGHHVEGPEPANWDDFLAAVAPDDRAITRQVIGDAVASGATFQLEFRWADGGSGGRWSFCAGSVIPDATGRTRRIVGIDIDITARKRLEEERRAFIDALEHDLKNPIAGMQMQIQLLRRRHVRGDVLDPDDLDARLGAIDQSIRRVSRRIQELAEYSRLETGLQIQLRLETSDLVAIVLRALEEAQAATGQHRITLATPVPPAIGMWDGERLERVFANLFTNAVKYSPAGGDISVEIRGVGDEVEVEVTDEGIGIPAADLPTLFDAGRRGTNVGTIRGSGIGLAGSAALIRLHGGSFEVASEIGRGSTFTVRLPVRTDGPQGTSGNG